MGDEGRKIKSQISLADAQVEVEAAIVLAYAMGDNRGGTSVLAVASMLLEQQHRMIERHRWAERRGRHTYVKVPLVEE